MNKVFIIAHRGALAYEPENTLRAIKRALDFGADFVEVDVRLSRDGHVVVIHDERVDRTTNGRGYVKDMTLDQLRRLDAGFGEKTPTLEEALDTVKERAILIIEIKVPEVVEKVVRTLEEKGMTGEVIVSSFYQGAVKRVKNLNPKIKTGIIYSFRPLKSDRLATEVGAEVLFPNYRYVDKTMVKEAHKQGLAIYPWTIDDPDEAKRLLKTGVDGVATNKPDLLEDIGEQ